MLPTELTALQTITFPLSERLILEMTSTLPPSGVRVDSMLSSLVSGKISDLFPSSDQKRVGRGNPFAWHSYSISEARSANCVLGRMLKVGGAVKN
jgi:hypothetical protein